MKTLLVGINSKYIHPNLAIYLLKNNTTYDVDCLEFTIKDSKNYIIDKIKDYDVIAFSAYIWNINLIIEILKELKSKTIILGGPEVSYNGMDYINKGLANYVIKSEGEEAFHLLLAYLKNDLKDITKVPNLYYQKGFTFDKLVDISKIKLAYHDIKDVENKIIYLETGRGCPYHCYYCMASLDNKLRFYDLEIIKNELLDLINRNARVFKFLDRTFNANKAYFKDLIDFIISNHKPNQSFQFEITGDILDVEQIEYINNNAPKNLFRFEIGIQTLNEESNKLVGRIQNNKVLLRNIKLINDANIIDLHLDLICGLPKETLESFKITFNTVLALKPKELQLGFLKLLKGTMMEKIKDKYNYKFQDIAPYEFIENNTLTVSDVSEIHQVENSFDHFYNKGYFKKTFNLLLDKETDYFTFFKELEIFTSNNNEKGLEAMFKTLDSFLINKSYYDEIHEVIILDYLEYYKVKPKAWWNTKLTTKERNNTIREINLIDSSLSLTDMYKYALIVKLKDTYLVAIYKPNERIIKKIKL